MRARFAVDFRTLGWLGNENGPEPLRWQSRMFERLYANEIPGVCDLPTGMGKTSVIHLWALALWYQIQENKPRLPIRLVYVVDRRTVVDQATGIAERIRANLPRLGLAQDWLTISTLRGQFADNREWTLDPSKPAIIIGTVDMIGSRLLFSGYRSSYKARPLHAGMLGQDTFVVLDEAHLSEPFEKLIRALSDRGGFQKNQGMPLRVMSMSATPGDNGPKPFRLEPTDLEGDVDTNPIIQRYDAKKHLVLVAPTEKSRIRGSVVETAAEMVERDNARVVVFTQSPDEAGEIANALRKRLSEGSVEVLTGTMRGLERDEMLEKEVMRRFLDGAEKPENRPGKQAAVLVSTSAGEVGFDLNADHLICDAAPLDSMIQRLGRVNRRGNGNADVRVYVTKNGDKPDKSTSKQPTGKAKWECATNEAMKCLERLAFKEDGTRDASPRAIDQLKQSLLQKQIQTASSPKPDTVELTDFLLDAWSMTTITARVPGRPPVAPWLRGLDYEKPQTSIAWRTELDVEGFSLLDPADIEEWFDAHPVLPHETLSVPSYKAGEWIVARWDNFSDEYRRAVGTRVCILDRGGIEVLSIARLVDELRPKRSTSLITNSDIVIPASFGGIQRKQGLLDADAPWPVGAEGNTPAPHSISDVADEKDERCRILEGETGVEVQVFSTPPPNAATFTRFALRLPSARDDIRRLISLVPKQQRLECGAIRQSLQSHVSLVEEYASEIAVSLSLYPDTFCEALRLAAKWHDCGKDREIWQLAVEKSLDEGPVGKSGGTMRRIAGGYRHEFGSLCEFAVGLQGKISGDVFDLAMHLIAAHHGRGRPHFPKGGFDPAARAESTQLALNSLRRFARLQRRYGYWQLAWLENLLRCADAMASRDKGGEQ